MPSVQQVLDDLLSLNISDLKQISTGESEEILEEYSTLIRNFIINAYDQKNIPEKSKHFVLLFLKRAAASVTEFKLVKQSISMFLEDKEQNIDSYFSALSHIQFSLSSLYLAYDSYFNFSEEWFLIRNNKSNVAQLNKIYDNIKLKEHSADFDEKIHPVLITNEGIRSKDYVISWHQYYLLLEDIIKYAVKLTGKK